MRYMLEDLKAVKHLRESSSERRLAARKREQKMAKEQVREKETELNRYRQYRLAKVAALFESVKGRMIGFKDFDDLKIEEKFLAEKEAGLKKDLIQSQTALEAAAQKVAKELAVYQRSVRENRKMKEHKKLVIEELIMEEEYKNELETEELHHMPN